MQFSNLLSCFFLLSASIAVADSYTPTLEADVAAGVRSNYGNIGAGVRVFPSNALDLHANAGFGLSGVALGAGARFYFLHSETPFLFVIPSSNAMSLGFTVLNTSGGLATIDNNVAQYTTMSGRYLNFHFEFNSWLWRHLALPVEIGYSMALKKPSFQFENGTRDADFERSFTTYTASGFLMSIGIGLAL